MHPDPLPGARVHALAPAKVNLQLRLHGLRPDGYHELQTSMLAIDWFDELWLGRVETPGLALSVDGEYAGEVPRGDSNLAWRAADCALQTAKLQKAVSPSIVSPGVRLHLRKHLPAGSGLGGGSSDAAAVFLACQAVLENGAPSGPNAPGAIDLVATTLAGLGSDCVFFAKAASTGLGLCTGRGELVQTLPACARDWWIALLVPKAHASTAAVYAAQRTLAHTRLSSSARETRVNPGLLAQPLQSARQALFNDLEPAAFAAVPELGRWRALLDQCAFAHWRLSGSGSSFFGLYKDPLEAQADLEQVARAAGAARLFLRALRLVRPAGHGVRLHWL